MPDLDKRFDYIAPNQNRAPRHERLRKECKALAETIVELVPASREQSMALTHLENAMFAANAGIARNVI